MKINPFIKIFLIFLINILSFKAIANDSDSLYCNQIYNIDSEKKLKVQADYNTFFQYNFDNREFDYSKGQYTNSMTIHAVRFTPSIGLSVKHGNGIRHRVLIGIDVLRNMGEKPLTNISAAGKHEKDPGLNNWKLLKEITLFYHLNARLNKWNITAVAGIFPRYHSEANYGREMISDSLYFYDNNMEGLLLKFRSPKSYHEINCDWLSMYGEYRKEGFIISTYSESKIKDYFKIGFKSRMQHSACSDHVKEVIDNLLFIPFVGFDLSKFTFFNNLGFEIQWHQGLQNRRWTGKDGLVFPCGVQLVSDIRHWNVGINNTLFWGTNMMPFYNKADYANNKYGTDLYHQSPFYKVRAFSGPAPSDYDWRRFAIYDRLELYYRPKIASFIDLNISFVFFFNEKFSGWQQKISLIFSLDKLREKKDRSNKN